MQYTTLTTLLALTATLTHANPLAKGGKGGKGDLADLGYQVISDLASGDIQADIFSDNECKNKINSITVRKNSCYTGSPVGWSSMKVTGVSADFQLKGVITAYSKNNCGCPTCGSHGYDVKDQGCLKDFGRWGAANAVGLGGI